MEETLTAVKYQVGDSHHYITLREIKSGRNPLSQEAGLFYIEFNYPINNIWRSNRKVK